MSFSALLAMIVAHAPASAQVPIAKPGTVFVLDASGSMEGRMGTESKAVVARKAAAKMIEDLSAEQTPVGLISFGDQSGTCQSSRTVVPMGLGNGNRVLNELQSITPQYRAQTPLLEALAIAAKEAGPDGHVIAITDGIDTCQLNPCDLPEAFFQAKTSLILVGLDIPEEDRADLECLAESADGTYLPANSQLEMITLAEVTTALIDVSSRLKISRAEVVRDVTDTSAELATVRWERDRAQARADEMRDRQQALVALIDNLKLQLGEAQTTTRLTDEQFVDLRTQFNDLEDLNARQLARINELEEALDAEMVALTDLREQCTATETVLATCEADLQQTAANLSDLMKDMELQQYAFSEAFLIAEDERLSLVDQLNLAREETLAAEKARDLAKSSVEIRNSAFSEFANTLVGLRKSEENARLESSTAQNLRLEAEAARDEALLAAKGSADRVEDLLGIIDGLEADIAGLRMSLEKARDESADLNRLINETRKNAAQSQATLETKLSQTIQKAQADEAALREEMATQVSLLTNERDTLRARLEGENQNLSQQLATTEAQATADIERLTKDLTDLRALYVALQSERRAANEAAKAAKESLENEIARLTTILDQVRSDQGRLRSQLANQDPSYASLSSSLRTLNRAFQRCEADIRASEADGELMALQLSDSLKDIDALETELVEQDLLIAKLIEEQFSCNVTPADG